ncbi:MAG TPA: hypothetical protein VGN43_05715 [Steroidobacteraceae bacterium]|jgi:hypothetical protein|nr:hypothetical protein [Steroidobacteraceae bacterium]
MMHAPLLHHRCIIDAKEAAVAENREQQPDRGGKGVAAEKHIPVNAHENTAVPDPPSDTSPRWHEPDGVQKEIADADKVARTGSTQESVRNTPPAGRWNETSED